MLVLRRTPPLSRRQRLRVDWKLRVHGGWLEWMGSALDATASAPTMMMIGASQMIANAHPALREVAEPESEIAIATIPQIVPTGRHGKRISSGRKRDSIPSYVRPNIWAIGQT